VLSITDAISRISFTSRTVKFINRSPQHAQVFSEPLRNASLCREAIVYIPESDLWKPIPKMPTRRSGCLGAAVDGIFYVIGGYNLGEKSSCFSSAAGPHLYMSSMDSYDPETNTWRETKEGLPLLARVIACTVMGSHIYVLCSDPRRQSHSPEKANRFIFPEHKEFYLDFSFKRWIDVTERRGGAGASWEKPLVKRGSFVMLSYFVSQE
jgi:hypothetical protein